MTTTNIFFKLSNSIQISKKLNLILKNIDDLSWKDSIVEDVRNEIIERKKVIKKYKFNQNLSYSNKGIKYLIDKVLTIEIADLQKSLYSKVNDVMDNPTCEEKTFQAKFIDFYNFIISNTQIKNTYTSVFITYDSMPINSKTNFLGLSRFDDFRIKNVIMKCEDETNYLKQIDDICKFGNYIDNYIKDDDNFFELKYIIDAINTECTYNAFYIFKIFSILEMILKDKKHNSWEDTDYNNFSKYIYDKEIENKKDFAKLVIQIRNKIAHCDTKGLYKKLSNYKNEYMKYYYFDYYEYSEENWIYLNLSCKLNTILADILYSKIINENYNI